MSTAQRVIGNTMWLYLRMGVSIVVNIFTTRILLEALGASDFGLYNVVGGAIAMLGFLRAALTPTTQRFINYAEGEGLRENVAKIFNNAVAIHLGLALFTVLFLGIAGIVFFNGVLNIPEGRNGVAIAVYVCMLISTIYSISVTPYEAVLNAHENLRFYSILGISDVVFKLIIAICVAVYGYDRLLLYAILMAAESWLLRWVTQAYCKKHYSECRNVSIRKHYDKQVIKEMTSFAGSLLVNTATAMVSLFGMSVVVNHFFDATVNAALGVATQLAGVVMAVSTNMVKALTPVLVKREGGGQHGQVLAISHVGCKFSYLLVAFVSVPVLLWLPFGVGLWLHEVPEWTVTFCAILIIGNMIEQMTSFLAQPIFAMGKVKAYNLTRSAANILPVLLSIAVFKIGGFPPYWALLFWCVFRYFVGGIIILYYADRIAGTSLSFFVKSVMAPCLLVTAIACGVGLVIKASQPSGAIFDLIAILVLVGVSVPVYWFLALNAQERAQLRTIGHSMLKR